MWIWPKVSPTESQVRSMVGLVIEKIVYITMSNHMYTFNNEVRVQNDCGPTGLVITGVALDVFMLWWDSKFLDRLKEMQLSPDIYVRFKDDCNILGNSLPAGAVYCKKNKEIIYPSKLMPEVFGSKIFENDDENTLYIFQQIANDVDSMISFTYDVPSKHIDGKMPILDVKVNVDKEGILYHEFYEKPTKNDFVILADSAINWQSKRTILTQEALRRMRNTSIKLGVEVQNKHLEDFMIKLKKSGYSEKFRAEIIKSAKSAFKIQLDQDNNGSRPLFRDRERIISDKAQKSKVDWWNKGSQRDPKIPKFTSVLFVPPTPGSGLAKAMQKREAELNVHSGLRIKIVEKGGAKLKNLVVKKNPFKTEECLNKRCPVCKSTSVTDPVDKGPFRVSCRTPSVVYEFTCQKCQESGKTSKYIGETGRPINVRGIEHVRDYIASKPCNPLAKHHLISHPDEKKKVRFNMKINKVFKDPLTRQANEGVKIFRSANHASVLNSKSEFNHPPTNRVIISNRQNVAKSTKHSIRRKRKFQP